MVSGCIVSLVLTGDEVLIFVSMFPPAMWRAFRFLLPALFIPFAIMQREL
jgi:hypothetical protein